MDTGYGYNAIWLHGYDKSWKYRIQVSYDYDNKKKVLFLYYTDFVRPSWLKKSMKTLLVIVKVNTV